MMHICFRFELLHHVIGLKKQNSHHFAVQSEVKKGNRDSLTHVFVGFSSATRTDLLEFLIHV